MRNISTVHPTAIVGSEVEFEGEVAVGAYAIIKGPARIGAGTVIRDQCVIEGPTIIGRDCKIGPAAFVGLAPQHVKFVPDDDNPTYLVIGDNVTIRESARVHRSINPGLEHATRIGDGCYIMGAAHIAHDCILEPDVVMADNALLGGHCQLGRKAFVGGGATIHQFVRLGRLCIIAGNEAVSQDVPPFGAARYGRLKGYNAIGCRRAGLPRNSIAAIRAVYYRMRTIRTMSAVIASIRSEVPETPEVAEVLQFIESSRRGILPAFRNTPLVGSQASSDGDEAGSD
jgi:UDP-N-acetylglucosamine acyltransferase